MLNQKNFYSRQEAAKALGVCDATISNYVKKGLLINATGERGPLRITGESVQAMLDLGGDIPEIEKNINKYREHLQEQQKMLDAWKTDINTRSEERDFREFIRANAPFLNEHTSTIIDTLTQEILNERERNILMSMCKGGRLSNIADEYCITSERARMIGIKAIKRIQAAMRKTGMLGSEVESLRIENEKLKAENEILISQLRFGSRNVEQNTGSDMIRLPKWMCEDIHADDYFMSEEYKQ